MGIRIYRRFGVLSALTLNVSKSGASASVGVKGAHLTVSKDGVRETVGLPGTGISYTAKQPWRGLRGQPGPAPDANWISRFLIWCAIWLVAAGAAASALEWMLGIG
jgi:hypothetical protein